MSRRALMSSGGDYVAWRYDRARALGVDILKLLLQTNIVIGGVPIIFYNRVEEVFGPTASLWLPWAWSFILLSLLSGFVAFLLIFEEDYHAAHMESDKERKDFRSAGRNEEKSNIFLTPPITLGL